MSACLASLLHLQTQYYVFGLEYNVLTDSSRSFCDLPLCVLYKCYACGILYFETLPTGASLVTLINTKTLLLNVDRSSYYASYIRNKDGRAWKAHTV